MYVGVGYSENPVTESAGKQAAQAALDRAGKIAPDMVLLFATARYNAEALRAAVVEIVGPKAIIVGGGAIGAITNDAFGYAGDQVGLAAVWFTRVRCDVLVERGLDGDEEEVGKKLGVQLAKRRTGQKSPVVLFYDAIDRGDGGMRMIMATHLLRGMEQGLGFLPDLVGAGLQGDYQASPTMQWTGRDVSRHTAFAMAFSGEVRLDHVILHGCRPATGYYTVTKAEGQTILEINGRPALEFMDALLDSSIEPDDYPFFLIFGVNYGEKWGEYDEKSYASRLCLAIDEERGGIVMFEPDMVEGTEFQIMYRSLDLDYMVPRIENLFDNIDGHEPVFALYIDCAGRAAGYGGDDMEDAVVLQRCIADRVPLLGIYSGVEIAPVAGRPRGLDWTGVFCLFSVPK